jgi:RES domain-containing protein
LTVWRLTRKRFADRAFDGEGARLYGGRWNHQGVAVVYCASTLSLAALELFVHLEASEAPDDLVTLAAEIPSSISIEDLDSSSLPANWRTYPGPDSLKDLGTAWARARRTAVLSVPSVVIQGERNVLLNPSHPDFSQIILGAPEPFSFDPRMWK